MNQKFLLDKVSLPEVIPNIQQKVANIINESNINVQSLIGNPNEVIQSRFIIPRASLRKFTSSFIYKPKECKLLDQIHHKLSIILMNPMAEKKERASIHITQPNKEMKVNKERKTKHQRNRTLFINDYHHFRTTMDSKCQDLYSSCVDFSSTIKQMPKVSIKFNNNEKSVKDMDEILLQNRSHKGPSKTRFINHKKFVREANIISKVSNELAFDARDILSKVFLRNTNQIDYSQADIIKRNTIKRNSMIKKANKLIQLSEKCSIRILNS